MECLGTFGTTTRLRWLCPRILWLLWCRISLAFRQNRDSATSSSAFGPDRMHAILQSNNNTTGIIMKLIKLMVLCCTQLFTQYRTENFGILWKFLRHRLPIAKTRYGCHSWFRCWSVHWSVSLLQTDDVIFFLLLLWQVPWKTGAWLPIGILCRYDKSFRNESRNNICESNFPLTESSICWSIPTPPQPVPFNLPQWSVLTSSLISGSATWSPWTGGTRSGY